MGFLDLFTHNKIKEPQVMKDVDMSELEKLNSLLDKVGDNQKEIVENQLKASMIGLDGEKRVMYELKHLSKPCLILPISLFLTSLRINPKWTSSSSRRIVVLY